MNNPHEHAFVTHPFILFSSLFNKDELTIISNYCNSLETEIASIGGNIENDIAKYTRTSIVSWVYPNSESEWFYNKISNKIDDINNLYYNFEIYGYEYMQYAYYNSYDGGNYKMHMDLLLGPHPPNASSLTRKLSASILINDNFNGGELEFTYGKKYSEKVSMKSGDLIVFPSYMMHQVNTVTQGIRNSLVVWCLGPKFK